MYNNCASNSSVTEFLTWQPHSSVDDTKTLLLDWIVEYEKSDNYNWVIELKDTKEIVGNISVVELKEKTDFAAFGYCMGKSWWGM